MNEEEDCVAAIKVIKRLQQLALGLIQQNRLATLASKMSPMMSRVVVWQRTQREDRVKELRPLTHMFGTFVIFVTFWTDLRTLLKLA